MQKVSRKILKVGLFTSIIILCFVIVAVIITGVNQFRLGSQLAGINHVSNLSHLLVRQQAKLFSLMLVKNVKNEELVDALDAFAQEEFVIDAHLYSTTGNLIAKSQNALPFDPKQNFNQSNLATQQIVEPIVSGQSLVGFLRVTFDTQYGQTTQHKVNQLFHLLYGELIILFLAGGLFVSCFYYLQRRRIQVVHKPRILNLEDKTQTQRFHARRRAFGRK